MSRPKVFLTGGDGIGWAVDEDLKLTAKAVASIVDLVDLEQSEVVHSVWWEGLRMIPPESLSGKRIICNVPGEPFRYFAVPEHRAVMPLVGRWVTRTSQAREQMRSIGIESHLIPYLIDVDTFKPLGRDDEAVASLRNQWSIPTGPYLIGSFQRDTEGSDLRSPKLVKGPDVLLEILRGLKRCGLDFHAVLAGPRRHWLIACLSESGIPFTYIGERVDGDDIRINTLPRATLNALYNLVDLYVVASRSEGGPHAILEAAASRCKVISTPVGMAADVLLDSCIFRTPSDATSIIVRDVAENALAASTHRHYDSVYSRHRAQSAMPFFEALYRSIESLRRFQSVTTQASSGPTSEISVGPGARGKARQRDRGITVGLWHSFFKPPYGGGNQFMMALRKGLTGLGVEVKENELTKEISAYVLNSIHFDVEQFLGFRREHRLNIIHRIDGPIFLIRGFDRDKDELCYKLNAQFASATVLQSAWTYQRIIDMGYSPVSPVIIHNAVDSEIFHARGRLPFDRNRKVRLISSSWSNNPRKGGPVYKWIEEHLDWDHFEYTFVGNASVNFDRIRHIPPVSSEELAAILRDHDIYITASRNDPCSNALIEALACGLPALYLNDGGHPELVGYGGLRFDSEEEILTQLDKLVDDYESFQNLIVVPTLESVSSKYLALIREVIQ